MATTKKRAAAKGKMQSIHNLPLPNQDEIDQLKPLTEAERRAEERPQSISLKAMEAITDSKKPPSDETSDLNSTSCTEDESEKSDYEAEKSTVFNSTKSWRRNTETSNPRARTYLRTESNTTSSQLEPSYVPSYPNPNDFRPEDLKPFPYPGYGSRDPNQMLYTFAPSSPTSFTDADVQFRIMPPTPLEKSLSKRFNDLRREQNNTKKPDEQKWGGGRSSDGKGVIEIFSYAGEGMGNATDGKLKGLKKFEGKEKSERLTTVLDKQRKKRSYVWRDEGWKKGGAKRRRTTGTEPEDVEEEDQNEDLQDCMGEDDE